MNLMDGVDIFQTSMFGNSDGTQFRFPIEDENGQDRELPINTFPLKVMMVLKNRHKFTQ